VNRVDIIAGSALAIVVAICIFVMSEYVKSCDGTVVRGMFLYECIKDHKAN